MNRKQKLTAIGILIAITMLIEGGVMLTAKILMDNPYSVMILLAWVFSSMNVILFNIFMIKIFKP